MQGLRIDNLGSKINERRFGRQQGDAMFGHPEGEMQTICDEYLNSVEVVE